MAGILDKFKLDGKEYTLATNGIGIFRIEGPTQRSHLPCEADTEEQKNSQCCESNDQQDDNK